MQRHDYNYPLRIDYASRRVAETGYAQHVGQMIRQVLLTEPGERWALPEFGCGLNQLVFAPHSEALQATTKLLVLRSLTRWLANEIEVREVTVSRPGEAPDGVLQIRIDYVLLQSRELDTALIEVGG